MLNDDKMSIIGNRYQLVQELGAGGMGIVYQAQDRLTGQTIALKRLIVPTEYLDFMTPSSQSSLLLSLAKEFEMLSTLRHPNIISVLDYGFDDEQQPYLTMELLENAQSITDYAQNQRVETKVQLLIQVLQALAYLHRRGVIHRDIKPANVLVVNGQIKVVDFGLSLKQGQDTRKEGTLGYMAPELISDQSPSERSDLFAVGVIAYELFGQKHPFYHGDLVFFVNAILHNAPDMEVLDIAEPIKLVIERLLSKRPEDRYLSALEAIEAIGNATGLPVEESQAVRDSFLQAATFVGRSTELTQLRQALNESIVGHGALWLIGGESGVGKSRLLDELRTYAVIHGVQVIQGQAVAEGGLAYQLWRDGLRRLLVNSKISDFSAGVLKPIVPKIDELLGRPIPDVPELEGKTQQQRLVLTILDVLKGQSKPLVVLLEDLQWADESLEPLKILQNQIRELPLLIVATYRNDERPTLPSEIGNVELLELQRLTIDSVAELSASILGEPGKQDHIVQLLQRETEGNVFFVVEVVRALAEEAGKLDNIVNMTLPRSVFAGGIQQVVRRRLDKVPAMYHHLLNLAAIAGRQLDSAILESLRGQVRLDEWLLACQNAAVLEVRDNTWRFSHDKLRESLLQDLDKSKTKPILHRQVAEAIESVYSDDARYASALAIHWQQAGNPEKERVYASIAGEQALKQFANSEALEFLSRAIELTPKDEQEARFRLTFLREEAYDRQGSREAQRLDLESLTELSNRLNDPHKRAETTIREAVFVATIGDLTKMLMTAQTAVELANQVDDSQLQGAAYNRLGVALHYLGRTSEALQTYEQALALVDSKSMLYGSILNNAGNAARAIPNYSLALTYLRQGLEFFQAVGHRMGEGILLYNIGNILYSENDFLQAQAHYQKAYTIHVEVGYSRAANMTILALGGTAAIFGDYSTAISCFEQALAGAYTTKDRMLESDCFENFGNLYLTLQEYSLAEDYLRKALAVRQEIDPSWIEIGKILYELGDVYLDQSDILRAKACYEQAVSYFTEHDNPANTIDRYTRQAAIALAENDLTNAEKHILRVQPYFEEDAFMEQSKFAQLCMRYAKTMQALGYREYAAQAINLTYHHLLVIAAKIDDEKQRQGFLNIRYHREIASLATEG